MKKHARPLLITLVFISGALLAYTTARAAVLSMTHDESTTFWLRGVDVLSCFFSADCWGNANIHLLNTWLMKRSEALFGVSELSLRLPNLLAHLLFLYASARLIWSLHRSFWVSVAGFLLINGNPYLLDFFSLARGYGLSIGLTMGSVAAYFAFLRSGRWSGLALSYGLAFWAIMANFVALNYLASLWGTALLMSLLQPANGVVWFAVDWRRQLWMNALPVAATLLLAVLLYTPIKYLQGGGEFHFGAEHFGDTFAALVRHSLYDVNYFSKDTTTIFSALYALLLVGALIGAFGFYRRRPGEPWRAYYLATALLFLLSCAVMIAQHYLLGSNYLLDRKSLIFFLLSGLLFYFLLHGLYTLRPRWGTAAAVLATLAIGYHSIRTVNFSHCREWWYDRHTREMVLHLKKMQLSDADTPVSLGVSWAFQPSTSFYLHHFNLEQFATPPMDGGLQTDGRYAFYYVFGGEYDQLKDRYEVEKTFPGGMYLLRRKPPVD